MLRSQPLRLSGLKILCHVFVKYGFKKGNVCAIINHAQIINNLKKGESHFSFVP